MPSSQERGGALAARSRGCSRRFLGEETIGTSGFRSENLTQYHYSEHSIVRRGRESYVVVGCTRSRWPFNSAGIEYSRVRIIVRPVLSLVNVEKWVPKSSSALLTGTSRAIQSPAGEMVFAWRLLSASQAWTAETLSCLGAM